MSSRSTEESSDHVKAQQNITRAVFRFLINRINTKLNGHILCAL